MPVSGTPREIMHEEMGRFKRKQLHSGSHRGPIVKSRPQAIAIALSESRKHGKPHRQFGGLIPGMSMPSPGGPQPADQSTPAPTQPLPSPSAMGSAAPPLAGLGDAGQPPSPPAMGGAPLFSGLGGSTAPSPPANPPAMSGLAGSGMGQPPPNWISPPAMGGSQSITQPRPPAFGAMQAGNFGRFFPNFGQQSSNPGANGGFGDWLSRFNPMLAQMRPQGRQFGGLTKAPNPSWTVRNEARSMLHSGPISSIVPGRTDRHNVSVKSGSYVMPADAVSHLGQNNTKAGQAILGHMFGSAGPYGMGKDMAMRHGPGAPKPPGLPRQGAMPHMPSFGKSSGFQSAGGGKGEHEGEPVPIVVAGGEFTVPPEAVAAIGGGDIKRGHKVLDQWVMSIRKKHISTLKGLPPPAKA